MLAGLAGGIVSLMLSSFLYGVSAPVLFNPQFQSPKILALYFALQPLPWLVANPAAFAAGWVTVGLLRGIVFAWLSPGLSGVGTRKGLNFGVVTWLTVVMFSEFYTAINLFGEPFPLVSLELVMLLVTFLAEGWVFGFVYARSRTVRSDEAASA